MSNLKVKRAVQLLILIAIILICGTITMIGLRSSGAQAQEAPDGTWSYEFTVTPESITTGANQGARIKLVATFQVDPSTAHTVSSLSVENDGPSRIKYYASVPDTDPQLFGFPILNDGTLAAGIMRRMDPTEGCVASVEAGAITCTISINNAETPILADPSAGVGDVIPVEVRTGNNFRIIPIINGSEGLKGIIKKNAIFASNLTLTAAQKEENIPDDWSGFTIILDVHEEEHTEETGIEPSDEDEFGTNEETGPTDDKPPDDEPPEDEEEESTPVNRAPYFCCTSTTRSVAENSASGTYIGSAITATDPDNDTLTYSLSGADASHFSVVSTSGRIRVKNALDYETDNSYSVTLRARDPGGLSDTIAVTINVTPRNRRPTARNDAATVPGVPWLIDVLANDSDPDGNSLQVSAVTDPPNGTTTVNADYTVAYVPDANYAGADSFTYTASDGSLSDTATVSITVTNPCGNDTAVPNHASNPGLVRDCNILLIVGGVLQGTQTLDWSAGGDIHGWEGITIEGNPERVTRIDIRNKNLDGAIPSDPASLYPMVGLDELVEIALNENDLTGPIPAQLSVLPKLEGIYAINNDLSGNLPAGLGNAPKLEEIYLNGNDLDGDIPAELGNISTLREIDLSGNLLDGAIPPALGNLSNLTELFLNSNNLTGNIPAQLGNLSNLVDLSLHHNDLDGSIPVELGQLSNLNRLYLQNNQLSGSIPAELGDFPSLYQIRINNNQLSGNIPPELGNLHYINYFYLASNSYASRTCIPGRLQRVRYNDFADTGLPFCTDPIIDGDDPITLEVAENTAPDTSIGTTFEQINPAASSVTWSTSGSDGKSFTIDADSGQHQTKDPLDYETKTQYVFTVVATNTDSEADAVSVTINVIDVDEAPVALDDTGTTAENVAVTVDVLANDSDPEGRPLTVTSVTEPTHGVANIQVDSTVTYTPEYRLRRCRLLHLHPIGRFPHCHRHGGDHHQRRQPAAGLPQ